jgi:2-polyprenyl-6-hydroxyphenyl methylase/3-demethylubiquinone-9 3-methyltransferase
MVTCMEMLEHVPPTRHRHGARCIVKPGGAVFLSTINRTPRAYVQAVVGAEYVLRLLRPAAHLREVHPPSESQRGAAPPGSRRGQ